MQSNEKDMIVTIYKLIITLCASILTSGYIAHTGIVVSYKNLQYQNSKYLYHLCKYIFLLKQYLCKIEDSNHELNH